MLVAVTSVLGIGDKEGRGQYQGHAPSQEQRPLFAQSPGFPLFVNGGNYTISWMRGTDVSREIGAAVTLCDLGEYVCDYTHEIAEQGSAVRACLEMFDEIIKVLIGCAAVGCFGTQAFVKCVSPH